MILLVHPHSSTLIALELMLTHKHDFEDSYHVSPGSQKNCKMLHFVDSRDETA